MQAPHFAMPPDEGLRPAAITFVWYTGYLSKEAISMAHFNRFGASLALIFCLAVTGIAHAITPAASISIQTPGGQVFVPSPSDPTANSTPQAAIRPSAFPGP